MNATMTMFFGWNVTTQQFEVLAKNLNFLEELLGTVQATNMTTTNDFLSENSSLYPFINQ